MSEAKVRKNAVPSRLRSFAKDQRAMLTRPEDLVWKQVRAGRSTNADFFGNPQLAMDQVLAAIERTKNPPPSAGEGGERSEPGEGAGGTGELAPSPATLRVAPSPAEGGG